MDKGYIEIEITEEGEIVSEVKGVLGADCEGLTDFLDEMGEVVEHRRTADFYRQQRATRRVQAGR
jgi:hypothetical protein